MKKYTPVEVTWLDSQGTESIWNSKDDVVWDKEVITSVGYFVCYDSGFLYIAQSISPDQLARRFRIPRKCIESICVLTKENSGKAK